MKRLLPVLLATLLLLPAAMAVAAPLQKADIDAQAQWAAHLDVEAWLKSELGQFVLQQMDGEQFRTRMAKFAETFGFDPTRDLRGVTVYGNQHGPAQAVAVIRANVDRDKLLALLRQNEGHQQIEQEGGPTIHRWVQKPEDRQDDGQRFGAFHGQDVTVISRSREALVGALAVLDGRAPSLSINDSGLLPMMPPGTIFAAGALDVQMPQGSHPAAAMLRAGSIAAGEQAGVLFANIAAITDSDIDGQRIRHLLQGMQAFGQLRLERLPPEQTIPELAQVLKGFVLGGQGPLVQIDFAASVEDVKAVMQHGPLLRPDRPQRRGGQQPAPAETPANEPAATPQ